MRYLLVVTILGAVACGGTTDTKPVRYNFGIVDGANQVSTAGDPALAKRITTQLARDPQGKFAARVFDFIAPAVAYAQSLTVPGLPVAGALVCAREAATGEPQAFPLCAFTGADGKAPIEIRGGTKAGVFNVLFSAQVSTQEPVRDSTKVTVLAGPMTWHRYEKGSGFTCWTVFPDVNVLDQFGNPVPYRFVIAPQVYGDASVQQSPLARVAGDTIGSAAARTFVPIRQSRNDGSATRQFEYQIVTVEVAGGVVIATGQVTVPNIDQACVWLAF